MLNLLISAVALAAPVEFAPEAQIRPRVEAHNGKDGAVGGNEVFVSQRARIGGTLAQGPISARVVVQDVRTWGEETDAVTDYSADGFDLYVGYLTWKPSENLGLHVGRQSLPIQGQRLVAAAGWAQQERRYDGARLTWKVKDFSGDVIGVVVADNVTDAHDDSSVFGVVRAGWGADANVVDLLYIPLSDASRNRLTHTVGFYTKGATGIVSGRLESYLQKGRRDGRRELAGMVGARGAVAPNVAAKPRFTLFYDHLTGESSSGDFVENTFDPLFGARHKFYGFMDVMIVSVGGTQDLRGLQDAALKFDVTPIDELKVGLDAHMFLPSAALNGGSVLGRELDLTAKVAVTEGFNVSAGASVLSRPNAELDLFTYLMLDAFLK